MQPPFIIRSTTLCSCNSNGKRPTACTTVEPNWESYPWHCLGKCQIAFKEIKHPNQCDMWPTSPGSACYLHSLIASRSVLYGCITFSLCCRSAITVSCSSLNPSRLFLFALAITRGKGLCMSLGLFSNSFFVFPSLIPICAFCSLLLIDVDCVFSVLLVSKFVRLGNSWGW